MCLYLSFLNTMACRKKKALFYNHYWNLADYNVQTSFISTCMQEPVKRKIGPTKARTLTILDRCDFRGGHNKISESKKKCIKRKACEVKSSSHVFVHHF